MRCECCGTREKTHKYSSYQSSVIHLLGWHTEGTQFKRFETPRMDYFILEIRFEEIYYYYYFLYATNGINAELEMCYG